AQEVSRLTEKVDGLNAQVSHEQRLANNLSKFRREIKSLEGKLEVALKQLPEKKEIPGLLESVATLAKDSGLEVTRFAPRPELQRDFYAAVPVDIDLRGTFHQVATFFDEIAGMSRIVNVNNVVLKDPQGVEGEAHVKVEVGCVVTTFRYIEPSERVAQIERQSDKKKRKGKKKTRNADE
ncbi:MAG: type 4a pilus biogenesis protein PilO, partial [Bdellovibrionales bacterium]|nr:type 4a pilus biogenesis protein PilO [Bdellovibrionales bacterium]